MWFKNLFRKRNESEKDVNEGVQTFKEFDIWCNNRACDGCWGPIVAMACIDILADIRKHPFWKREKEFQKIKDQLNEEIIIPINQMIYERSKK